MILMYYDVMNYWLKIHYSSLDINFINGIGMLEM